MTLIIFYVKNSIDISLLCWIFVNEIFKFLMLQLPTKKKASS